MAESDEQLVAAWQASGDRALLEELVARHLPTVRRMVHSMTLDAAVADDLVQEVFLRAVRGLGSFGGRAKFTTWLYRVALNTVHGVLARQRRSPVDGRALLPDGVMSPDCPPEAEAERAETDAAVGRALAALPAKLRAAIVLVTLEDIDPVEAARIEGCTRATIYWRLHEARKRLTASLREHMSR